MTSENRCSDVGGGSQEPSSPSGSRSTLEFPENELRSDECESALTDRVEESSSADVGPSCYVDSLPIEVLEKIFSYVSFQDWKQIRRVCSLWCQVSTRQRQVHIKDLKKIRGERSSLKHFKNCGLNRLKLSFRFEDRQEFPINLWEKIGEKIRSLQFNACWLGNQIIKKVILFCPNLQSLCILIESELRADAELAMCSAAMLKDIDVVRNGLKTLEIGISMKKRHVSSRSRPRRSIQKVDAETWRQIFSALFQVFPKVVHFKWMRTDGSGAREVFQYAFTRNEIELSENSAIASVLALLLSDTDTWTELFDALAGLSLSSFSLVASQLLFKDATPEDITRLKFCEKRNKLKSVKIDFDVETTMLQGHTLEIFLFKILGNCPELQDLEYFKNKFWPLTYLRRDQDKLSQLFGFVSVSKLEKLSISNFIYERNTYSLSSGPNQKYFRGLIKNWRPTASSLFCETLKIFCFHYSVVLQHLVLNVGLTDPMLQLIFEHFTKLKTLMVKLHSTATNFGLTGRPFENPQGVTGYSIGRLQRLEKLEIVYEIYPGTRCAVGEEILKVFSFPNLQHLSYMLPERTSTFSVIGKVMPELKVIHFGGYSDGISRASLLALCVFSRNLHTVHFECDVSLSAAQKTANLCPNLKIIHANGQIFRRDERNKQMVGEP